MLRRAERVAADYLHHARRLDARLHEDAVVDARVAGRQPPARDTAVETRLRAIGPVRPLVMGQYGEASPDVHATIALAAEAQARRQWRRFGARTEAEACAFFTQSYRRRLGVCVVREFARHRIRRVQMVGVARDHLATRPRAQPQLRFRPSPMEFYSFQVFTPQGGGT